MVVGGAGEFTRTDIQGGTFDAVSGYVTVAGAAGSMTFKGDVMAGASGYVLAYGQAGSLTEQVAQGALVENYTIAGNSSDGSIRYEEYGLDAWGAVHSSTTGFAINPMGASILTVLAEYDGYVETHIIDRAFLYFNIPAGSVVESATLNLYVEQSGHLQGSPRVVVQAGTQSTPLVLADFDNFTGGALSDTTSVTSAGAVSIPLNSAGVSFVGSNMGGVARLAIREYYDFFNIEPAGQHYAFFSSQDHATAAYRPTLVITYRE
jgi:hypothetical protein